MASVAMNDMLFSEANTDLDPDWKNFLETTGLLGKSRAILAEIEKNYYSQAAHGITEGTCAPLASVLCPHPKNIFAFARFPFANVRVIIIGQDPYPNRANAHGIAFSVPDGAAIPASLKNIFGALAAQKLIPESARTKTGNLEAWCQQGVVLLNSALTTVEGCPGSHVDIWSAFTRELAIEIGKAHPGSIYLLFGKTAQKIKSSIPKTCACLEWGHPSPQCPCNNDPLSPKNFIHCTAFKVANNMLEAAKKMPINWDATRSAMSLSNSSETPPSAVGPRAPNVMGTVTEVMLDLDDVLVCPSETMLYAFVDGSCCNNGKQRASAGYAAIVINTATMYQITGIVDGSSSPTNNRAELMALRDLFALMSSETFIASVGNMPVTVVYDSAYAVGCIREWYEQWCKSPPMEIKANLDIISVAHDFFKRVSCARTITWEKIKSHTREPSFDSSPILEWYKWHGNKKVDELAYSKAHGHD